MIELGYPFDQIRVTLCVPTVSESADGVGSMVKGLYANLCALDESGIVKLATLDTPSSEKMFPEQIMFCSSKFFPPKLGVSFQLSRWFENEVSTGEVKVIHSHGVWTMPTIYASKACREGKCALMVSPHGSLSQEAMKISPIKKLIYSTLVLNKALRRATCLHVTSYDEYQDVRRLGLRQPVALIPNAINVPPLLAKERNLARELLFLGRLHPIKGIENLLRAWAEIQGLFPTWNLLIVGPTKSVSYLNSLKALVKELRLERIVFSGAKEGARKLQIYRQADLYILPTLSENFGLTVAEALAAGTPAIVTNRAPWSGLNERNAGWSIEPTVPAIIKCLREAMAMPQVELERMGKSGHSWVKSDFDWENIALKFLRTYCWMQAGGPAPDWVHLD